MPLKSGKVFLEETCLVAKPALPFATLKRRLHRRMSAMGLKVGIENSRDLLKSLIHVLDNCRFLMQAKIWHYLLCSK